MATNKEKPLQNVASNTPLKKERLWTKDFIVVTLINFIILVNYFMLMVTMTSYTMDVYAAPEVVAAFCASIFIVGALVSRVITGALMVRFGRKRILLIGAVCDVIFTALYLVGGALPMLFALRFLHGFFYGMCSTAVGTIVTAIVPSSRKGEGVGYYMLSVTLGSALGPSLGIAIANNFSFSLLLVLDTFIAVLALIASIILKVPEVDKSAVRKTDATDAAANTDDAAQSVGANANGATPSTTNKPTPAKRTSWINRIFEVSALPISVVAGLIFFGYSALLTFLDPYAAEMDLTQAASFFFVVYAIIMFVTRPFTGRSFDSRGANSVMIPAFISFAVGMVLLGLTQNAWMLLISPLFLGFGVGTIQSSGLAIAVLKLPDERLSLANSTFYMMLDAGVGIGPLLLGAVVPLIGYPALYFGMALVGLLAMVLYLVIIPKRKRSKV